MDKKATDFIIGKLHTQLADAWDTVVGDELAKIKDEGRTFKDAVREFERRLITKALFWTDGNRTEAAALLDISREGLHVLLRKLGIPKKGVSP